ncbi:MAG: hypothetical protein LC637_10505 [Xanthomonadaceae bacterium]|nr:hypothetical protein [Xanthomonadaceae bacterium]
MRLIHTEPEAALLETARLSRQLAGRYRHSLETLIQNQALRERFGLRAEQLEQQAEDLEDLIRKRGLLPRDAETELNDLRNLASHVADWLDDNQTHELSVRFIDEEKNLLETLDKAATERELADRLSPMQQASRHILDQQA